MCIKKYWIRTPCLKNYTCESVFLRTIHAITISLYLNSIQELYSLIGKEKLQKNTDLSENKNPPMSSNQFSWTDV